MPDLALINPTHFESLKTILASDIKQNLQQLIDAINLLQNQFTGFTQDGIRYAGEVSTAAMVVSLAMGSQPLTSGTTILLQVTADLPEATLLTLKLNDSDPIKVVGEKGVQLRGKDVPNKSLLLLTYKTDSWVVSMGLASRKPYWIAPVPKYNTSTSISMNGKLEVPASGGGIIYLPEANRTVSMTAQKQLNGRDYEGPVTSSSTHVLYAVGTSDGLHNGYVISKNKSATQFFLALDAAPTEAYTRFDLVRQLPFHFIPREEGDLPAFKVPVWTEDYAEFEYDRIARGYNIADIPADDGDPNNNTVFQDKLLLRARSAIGYTLGSTFKWVPTTSEYMTVYAFCLGVGEMFLYNIDEPNTSPGNRLISTAGYSPEHKMRVKISKDPPRFAYKVISGDWYLQTGGYSIQL